MPENDIGKVKTQIEKEIKQLAKNTEQDCKTAKSLCEEETELAKKKDPSGDDKKRAIDLRKALQDLEKSYLTKANSTSARINDILKTNVPDDKKTWPEWQKGMDKWYRDLVEKEAGLDIGKNLKLTGEISIKDKKALIKLNGKF